MGKKLISLALALCMLLALLPAAAVAEGETCEISIYRFYSDSGFVLKETRMELQGTVITETAQAKEGYIFLGWYPVTEWDGSGAPCAYGKQLSPDQAYTFTLDEDMALAAVYEAEPVQAPAPEEGSSEAEGTDAASEEGETTPENEPNGELPPDEDDVTDDNQTPTPEEGSSEAEVTDPEQEEDETNPSDGPNEELPPEAGDVTDNDQAPAPEEEPDETTEESEPLSVPEEEDEPLDNEQNEEGIGAPSDELIGSTEPIAGEESAQTAESEQNDPDAIPDGENKEQAAEEQPASEPKPVSALDLEPASVADSEPELEAEPEGVGASTAEAEITALRANDSAILREASFEAEVSTAEEPENVFEPRKEIDNIWINSAFYQQETSGGCVLACCAMTFENAIGRTITYTKNGVTYTGFQAVYQANGAQDSAQWSTLYSSFGITATVLTRTAQYGTRTADQIKELFRSNLLSNPNGILAFFRMSKTNDSGHCVVIIGYRDGIIYVNDPARSSSTGKEIPISQSYLATKFGTNSQDEILVHLGFSEVHVDPNNPPCDHEWSNAGICTKCNRTYKDVEWPSKSSPVEGTATSSNPDQSYIVLKEQPYGNASQVGQVNTATLIRVGTNHYNNTWYELSGIDRNTGASITGFAYADNLNVTLTPHTHHDKGTYLFYEAVHPHRNAYRCSICGEVWVDEDSSNYMATCDSCLPGKPVFIGLSGSHLANTPITFQWNSTANTTHYNFWLYKENSSGGYDAYEHTFYVESGFQRSLDAGNYKAVLQSYDSNHWRSDGSDWAYTESDPVYFSVALPQFYLDLNGCIDGAYQNNIVGYGTADVYINGQLVSSAAGDYWTAWPTGTSYELKNIRPMEGYAYTGIYNGTRSGTISADSVNLGSDIVSIEPSFRPVLTVVNETPVEAVYNGHTYYYYSTPVTWYDAKAICENMGGHLATISGSGENNFVYSLAQGQMAWLGATDAAQEGSWQWITGESYSYSNWSSGNPDNYSNNDEGAENYLHFSGSGGGSWNDNAGFNLFAFVCEKDTVSGWVKQDGKWYYYFNGTPATSWRKLGGKWYYFNNSGVMLTGWRQLNGNWYYFHPGDDGSMATGWKKLEGKWYYFNLGDSGVMQTGWKQLNGNWYYFNPGSDGSMATGWKKLDGKWYYFNLGDSGVMQTGWKQLDGKWYYFGSDGAMVTGWQRIDSKWYYFIPGDNGSMVANTTMTIDGKSYTFASSGECLNP